MKALIDRNRCALPVFGMAVSGSVVMLLLAASTESEVMAKVASGFGLVALVSGSWLLFKLGVWLMKPLWARTLAGVIVVGASWYLGSGLLAVGGFVFIGLASAYWWLDSQIMSSDKPVSYKEKLYWYWVNEFTDGRTPFLPRKPKR